MFEGTLHSTALRMPRGDGSWRPPYGVPFGGYKISGYGCKNGLGALQGYTNVKLVRVELSGATRDPFRLG